MLKRCDDVLVTKADKGGKVVIINKSDYINKMNVLLGDVDTYKEIKRKNVLKDWQTKYNRELATIFADNREMSRRFNSFLPTLPYIYGLPKIHKPNNPLRPIVSTRGSVTYALSKYLSSLLSPLLGTISNSHLINSDDFVDKTRKVNLVGKKLVSFDVNSLFTNVPVEETLLFLQNHLQDNPIDMPFSLETLVKLLRLCLDHCYFSFNGKYFIQQRGYPMGNCLSPVLCNLYMEHFERDLLQTVVDFEFTWFRYVDDVFAVVPDNLELEPFLRRLNSLSTSITFTMEVESGGMLPFLDVCVSRNYTGFPTYRIYRKPTHSNTYIHRFSAHPTNVKLGTISGLFLRAYRLCNADSIDDEIEYVTEVFLGLGYERPFIKKAHFKARRTFYLTRDVEPRDTNYVVLPSVCEGTNVGKLFPEDVRLVYGSSTVTKSFLRNGISKGMKRESGIYSIPCNSCDLRYIGETDDFERRMKNHRNDIRNEKTTNPIVKHILENDHRVNIGNSKLVKRVNNVNERKLIETILINNVPNFNIYQNSFNIDISVSNILFSNISEIQQIKKYILDHG